MWSWWCWLWWWWWWCWSFGYHTFQSLKLKLLLLSYGTKFNIIDVVHEQYYYCSMILYFMIQAFFYNGTAVQPASFVLQTFLFKHFHKKIFWSKRLAPIFLLFSNLPEHWADSRTGYNLPGYTVTVFAHHCLNINLYRNVWHMAKNNDV